MAYLNSKDRDRENSVLSMKQALIEDVNYRREISHLKKVDQQENLRRGAHFRTLEKELLWSKLQEKKAKADQIIIQRERIAQACAVRRNSRMSNSSRDGH